MSKHIPWEVDLNGGHPNNALIIQRLERSDRMIARHVAVEHAPVIAAAPELLAAAQETYRYATDAEYRAEKEAYAEAHTAGNLSYQEVLLEQLRVAIEKASATPARAGESSRG